MTVTLDYDAIRADTVRHVAKLMAVKERPLVRSRQRCIGVTTGTHSFESVIGRKP